MEFNTEVSPYIRLTESSVQNVVEFQHARLGSPRGIDAPPCDTSFFFLSYDVYAYFLTENDYSEEEYFRGIEIMSDVATIQAHATKVKPITFSSAQRTRSVFMSYPGRGVIYNVIASYESRHSAYVPVGTYNCDFSYGIEQCGKLSSIPSIIVVTAAAAMGLVVCLKGHQWFQLRKHCILVWIRIYNLWSLRRDDILRLCWIRHSHFHSGGEVHVAPSAR